MPANPQAFARRVIDTFTAAGLLTDAMIGAAGGPSTTTMTKLRKVADGEETMPEPREPTWSKIDRAARWMPGSARRVWAGRDPQLALEDADAALDDVLTIVPAFDDLPDGTRGTLVDIARALADDSPVRADFIVRDRTTDAELAVEVKQEWSGLSHHSAELVSDTVTELFWDHPAVTKVVVQVASDDGSLSGFTLFRRGAIPVRERWADAARDIGGPSRGQRDRDAAAAAGEPPADDPDDMEPR